MRSLFLLFFCLLFISSSAKNYYVDSVTGKNENPGISLSTAFRDFTPLVDIQLSPGDSVLFARGIKYAGMIVIKNSGTESNPIVLAAYGKGADPVFTNSGKRNTLIIEGDFIHVLHLAFSDVHESAIQINSENCRIENCTIAKAGTGINLKGKHNKIFNNYIHHLHIIKSTEGGDDDYGAIGILISNGNQEIAYNIIDSCIDKSLDYGIDGGGFEFYGDADSVYIHHNYISNSDGVFEFGAGTIRNINFYYNVFVNNGELGGFHFRGKFFAIIKRILIANNTVVDTVPDQSLMLWFNGTGQEQNIRVVNNIFYFSGFKQFSSTGNFKHNNNLYYSPANTPLGFNPGPSEIYSNPGFKNLSKGNFELRKNSPAINKGIWFGFKPDYKNHLPDRQPDLGAFEYISR